MNDSTDFIALLQLPLKLFSGQSVTAVRHSAQLPEAIVGDTSTGWVEVPEGAVLAEVVIDGDTPTNRVLRMAIFTDKNILEQIEQKA